VGNNGGLAVNAINCSTRGVGVAFAANSRATATWHLLALAHAGAEPCEALERFEIV
jgi:hypothetical protein